ncbi:Fungalysin/Thermolysin Extracellular metalloproteinase 5 [Geranomyces variabilis]|nr:Fungalysin/Thermolysin Extracellular metalloproteinase 5 [Geranomyces variabilis]
MGGDSTPVGPSSPLRTRGRKKNSPKGWQSWSSSSTSTKETSGTNVKAVDKRTGKPLKGRGNNVYDWAYDFEVWNATIVSKLQTLSTTSASPMALARRLVPRSLSLCTDTFVASFSTPPDGQAPRFTFGTVSADMLIHELGQGILQRLTGGPSNAGCLIENEAGGMGEGLHGHFPHKGQYRNHQRLFKGDEQIWK